nr:hypothetical protein [Tanacetum cinerariifolium]
IAFGGWPFDFAVPGQMTHLVASMTVDSARSLIIIAVAIVVTVVLAVFDAIIRITAYYLLVEKMYPLTNYTLTHMWNDVRLQVDYEVEMTYDLLRLVRRQLREGYIPE